MLEWHSHSSDLNLINLLCQDFKIVVYWWSLYNLNKLLYKEEWAKTSIYSGQGNFSWSDYTNVPKILQYNCFSTSKHALLGDVTSHTNCAKIHLCCGCNVILLLQGSVCLCGELFYLGWQKSEPLTAEQRLCAEMSLCLFKGHHNRWPCFFETLLWPLAMAPVSITGWVCSLLRCLVHLSLTLTVVDRDPPSSLKCQFKPHVSWLLTKKYINILKMWQQQFWREYLCEKDLVLEKGFL